MLELKSGLGNPQNLAIRPTLGRGQKSKKMGAIYIGKIGLLTY